MAVRPIYGYDAGDPGESDDDPGMDVDKMVEAHGSVPILEQRKSRDTATLRDVPDVKKYWLERQGPRGERTVKSAGRVFTRPWMKKRRDDEGFQKEPKKVKESDEDSRTSPNLRVGDRLKGTTRPGRGQQRSPTNTRTSSVAKELTPRSRHLPTKDRQRFRSSKQTRNVATRNRET